MDPRKSPIDQGVVLVTGASSGIGAELARQMAPRAKRLVLVARRLERLSRLAEEFSGHHPSVVVKTIACDLSDLATCAAIDGLDEVDVLVNNAGIGNHALFENGRAAAFDAIVRLNVIAPVTLTRAVLPGMIERGRGGILNIGSGAALTPMPGEAVYTASKHFLHGLSSTLYLELEGTGVRVTEAMPGPVATEFDDVAGIGQEGGGLPRAFRISAKQCAEEIIAAFDRAQLTVYPGRLYRALMFMRGFLPTGLQLETMRRPARMLRSRVMASSRVGSDGVPGAAARDADHP